MEQGESLDHRVRFLSMASAPDTVTTHLQDSRLPDCLSLTPPPSLLSALPPHSLVVGSSGDHTRQHSSRGATTTATPPSFIVRAWIGGDTGPQGLWLSGRCGPGAWRGLLIQHWVQILVLFKRSGRELHLSRGGGFHSLHSFLAANGCHGSVIFRIFLRGSKGPRFRRRFGSLSGGCLRDNSIPGTVINGRRRTDVGGEGDLNARTTIRATKIPAPKTLKATVMLLK
jgi:hypothetical protein